MAHLEFHEFLDKKKRDARKHLKLMKELFQQGGFKVADHLNEKDGAYLYLYNPKRNLSFDGVRVYEIGGDIAYRIQKEEATHPYGRAYCLPVPQMFEDLLGEEDMKDEQIGAEICKSVISEIKSFFDKSYEAEKRGPPVSDPLGKIHTRTGGGGDYANSVMGSGQK